MKTMLTLTLALGVAALLACGKAEDSKAPDKATSGADEDCCKATEALVKQVPTCCTERLKGGAVTSECCKATEADPAKPSPCCKKTKELMGKMSDCCKKVLAGGKATGCCESMAK